MSEEWKDIKGYEGLYQISNLGRVKSLNYNKTKQEKILKAGYSKEGYAFVNLCKKGKNLHITVHKLVATAFIENPNNYTEINHKDENRSNNNVKNLEWCSHLYNMNYGTGIERRSQKRKIPVNQYDKLNNFIKKWASAIDVQNSIGINQSAIIACCKGKNKTAGGYTWKYVEEDNK